MTFFESPQYMKLISTNIANNYAVIHGDLAAANIKTFGPFRVTRRNEYTGRADDYTIVIIYGD